jgi:hypothetical protein
MSTSDSSSEPGKVIVSGLLTIRYNEEFLGFLAHHLKGKSIYGGYSVIKNRAHVLVDEAKLKLAAHTVRKALTTIDRRALSQTRKYYLHNN